MTTSACLTDQQTPMCGQRFETKREYFLSWLRKVKRIVGGSESQQGSWPWQIALLINGVQWCGGSIIDKNWIVTAGHCVLCMYSIIIHVKHSLYAYIRYRNL